MPGWLQQLIDENATGIEAHGARSGLAAADLRMVDRRADYAAIYGEREVRGTPVNVDRVRTFIVTTSRVATDMGVLLPDGMDTRAFDRRPLCFWSHLANAQAHAIGRWLDRRRITTPEDGWEMDLEFAPEGVSDVADDAFRFIDWSGIGAASVGFDVVDGPTIPTPEEVLKYGIPKWGWIGRKWVLREISLCHIPADAGCIMRAAENAGTSSAFRTATGSTGRAEAEPVEGMAKVEAAIVAVGLLVERRMSEAEERINTALRNLAVAITEGFAALVNAEDEDEDTEASATNDPAHPPAGEVAAPAPEAAEHVQAPDNIGALWTALLECPALAELEKKVGV